MIDIDLLLDKIKDVKKELDECYDQKIPLDAKYRKLNIQLDKLENLLFAYRTLCEHDWVDDGTTNHGRVVWQRCSKCKESQCF